MKLVVINLTLNSSNLSSFELVLSQQNHFSIFRKEFGKESSKIFDFYNKEWKTLKINNNINYVMNYLEIDQNALCNALAYLTLIVRGF